MRMEPDTGFRITQPKLSVIARAWKFRWSFAERLWDYLTYFQKKFIFWQDRKRWFGYQDWITMVENREIRRKLRGENFTAVDLPSISFLLVGGIKNKQAVLTTVKSLPQLGQNQRLFFLLPEKFSLNHDSWFGDLITKNSRFSTIKSTSPDCPDGWLQVAKAFPADWIIPLRAGDVLSPAWMEFFRTYAAGDQEIEILYWDEDEIDGAGKRSSPFFKPDWSPELLFSVNYLETAAFRKSLLDRCLQSHQSDIDAWIFMLANKAEKIVHIPFVLHHRLPISPETKNQALQQHLLSAKAFISMQGCKEVEVRVEDGSVRMQWKSETPRVSVIIPTKNNFFYLHRCLSSLIERTRYADYEILLMDDHSTDEAVLAYYQELLSTQNNVHVYHNDQEFNYSRVNNQGARLAQGELLLFLNNDVEIIDPGWLEELVRWCLLPGVGIVGAKLLYPEGMIQHAGIVLGMTGHADHLYAGEQPEKTCLFLSADWYRNVSAVTGACMLIRQGVFKEIGGFDESFSLVFNDVEIGLRAILAGYRIVYTPAARLIHYEGRSRVRFNPRQDIWLGAERLRSFIEVGDRYYNPNLSLAVNWPTYKRVLEPSALARLEKIVQFKG